MCDVLQFLKLLNKSNIKFKEASSSSNFSQLLALTNSYGFWVVFILSLVNEQKCKMDFQKMRKSCRYFLPSKFLAADLNLQVLQPNPQLKNIHILRTSVMVERNCEVKIKIGCTILLLLLGTTTTKLI